ncbi:MAG: hypothetical protein Kow0022_02750 [Phycisphaerales bacterium]
MARWLNVLAAIVIGVAPGWAVAHPQDGPHADIRIAIDETGVHFSMMINLAFVDEMVDFPRESLDAVASVEEDTLGELLKRYFEKCPVGIDGVDVLPVFKRFEVVRADAANLYLFPRVGMRGLILARVELEYPAKSMPRMVRLTWSTYPANVLVDTPDGEPKPPMTIEAQLTAEGTVDLLRFTRAEPEVIWHGTGLSREQRFLEVPDVPGHSEPVKVPILSLGMATGGLVVMLAGIGRIGGHPRCSRRPGSESGAPPEATVADMDGTDDPPKRPAGRLSVPSGVVLAGGVLLLAVAPALRNVGTLELSMQGPPLPTEAQARAIFEPLHANIYRAFDYEERSDIYDALARSVSGELLETLYNQIYTSLIMYDQGGAVSRVSAVRLMDVNIKTIAYIGSDQRPGFSLEARWQVDGVVYHEGHSHRRTNEYLAEYTVARLDPGWRITGNRIISQERLDPDTGERPKPFIPDGEI